MFCLWQQLFGRVKGHLPWGAITLWLLFTSTKKEILLSNGKRTLTIPVNESKKIGGKIEKKHIFTTFFCPLLVFRHHFFHCEWHVLKALETRLQRKGSLKMELGNIDCFYWSIWKPSRCLGRESFRKMGFFRTDNTLDEENWSRV